MIFSSIQYLIFLPLVAIIYWRTSGVVRLGVVVAASFFFYMSWLPIYGLLLALMTTLNWGLGLAIQKAGAQSTPMKKALLTVGLLGNLGCLFYYKYANFLLSNVVDLFNFASRTTQAFPQSTYSPYEILLPLGISFFVFEFVHYLTDVYRGEPAIKSWLEFAAFASFFPSQIAGPVKRFQEFLGWLRNPLPWSQSLFAQGGTLIAQGMFKKVAIADPIGGIIATAYVTTAPLSSPEAWIASIGFVIQCYCDFSGYTDIARGSALWLGIELPENFALPYMATDLTEFWRRWHMSLSTWLRDYLYLPLGGSRKGKARASVNQLLTMVACGLWHGAAWHYIAFGALHGVGLIVNRQWKTVLEHTGGLRTVLDTNVGKVFSLFVTMLYVTMTETIFRAPNLNIGFNVLQCWFSADTTCTLWVPMLKSSVLVLLGIYMGFWAITDLLKSKQPVLAPEGGQKTLVWTAIYPNAVRYASWTAAIFLIVAARPTSATPFVYFQF